MKLTTVPRTDIEHYSMGTSAHLSSFDSPRVTQREWNTTIGLLVSITCMKGNSDASSTIHRKHRSRSPHS